MNGYRLLDEAARLIGLESADENIKIIGFSLVNEIITELGFVPLSSLSEKIGISSYAACSALRFGVAALIANAIGDEEAKNTMYQLYLKKYSRLTSKIERVKDVMPKGEA